eukprot:766311-Hanusia_phi.AAC.3
MAWKRAVAAVAVVMAMTALVMVRTSSSSPQAAGEKNSMGWTELEQEGGRGRVRGRARHTALRADSSLSDFFKAAMNGDFQRKKTVDLATDGLLGPRQLAARRHAREQSLAESSSSPAPVHVKHPVMMRQSHIAHQFARKHVEAAGSAQREQLRQIEKKISKKYPSEDKFVATYRGSLPRGDVPVDAVSFGPYVPL